MKDESTIKGYPAGNLAMDYASLRQEGIRQLERLAGTQWTDFNEHDPGITILEQYCYALTELAYRCDFPLPDLLSRDGRDTYGSLFSPAKILASRPVTVADMRKLAVDVRGVKNAWIEKADDASPNIFHNPEGVSPLQDHQENLIQLETGEGAQPLRLKGLYRVLIETSDVLGVDSAEVMRNVAERLLAQRPLCMDFESVEVMAPQQIQVRANIEIGPGVNPEKVYAAILLKIAAHISPSIRFYTLAQRLSTGKRIDEIFDGPALEQGFIDTGELSALERKTSLRVSDIIREIMDVNGVLMVTHLALRGANQWEDWWLDLAEGQTPVLDIGNSQIRLSRQQIEVRLDYQAAEILRLKAQDGLAYRPANPDELDLVPPKGRDRGVGRYYSAQHQFPEVYGLGERGLPPQASGQRRAQLKQLQAYLLLFDQLLANQFAQLAHVGNLLGFDDDGLHTYFAGDLDDPGLRLDGVWKETDAKTRGTSLGAIVENLELEADVPDFYRKNRFLDHLLARFAEQFKNYAEFRQLQGTPDDREKQLARDKLAWLRRYPTLSAGRGAGFNAAAPWNLDSDNCSGLEMRLRIKLGLDPQLSDERLYLVEHMLLRPLPSDMGEQGLPLLAQVRGPDPYSLQASLVLPAKWASLEEGSGFRRFVEKTIREETPVHLLVYALWLEEDTMASFAQAYQAWQDSQYVFRMASEQRTLSPLLDKDETIRKSLKLRDARDRLVDLLAIGQTYPIADLPVRYAEIVAWGQQGRVTLVASQAGVLYQLLDKGSKSVAEGYGNGEDLILLTPVVTSDIGFTVRANKPHASQFPARLGSNEKVHVQNSRLDTRYELCGKDGASFNPTIDSPGNGGELLFTPPTGSQDQDFTIKAVKILSVTLFQSIDIKVGLDTTLNATILDAELLDPSASSPGLADPRIVDYGAKPRVEIKSSQAGVEYLPVYVILGQDQPDFVVKDTKTQAPIPVKFISAGTVLGDSHDVDVATLARQEDTDLRVLATKTFDPKDNQKDQSALLDVVLPLKVKANPGLEVDVAQALLDYGGASEVVVKASQASANYQIYTRPIADSEFVREKNAHAFDIPGMDSLWVAKPPNPTTDALAVGKAIAGNGQDLPLPIDGLKEDALIVVWASKLHQTKEGQEPQGSSLQLVQPAAILVRPGPDAVFSLRLKAEGDKAPADSSLHNGLVYQVSNGQPGVYYHFRLAGSDKDLGLPVYFHKEGKGIEGLAVEIDFAVTGNLPTPPPEWDCPVDLAADAKLSIRAVKAQTGLEIVYERTVGDLFASN